MTSNDPLSIAPEDLGRDTKIGVSILPTDVDLYHDIATTLHELVEANNARGAPTCLIIPVGPVGQYERLARLCNHRRTSLRDVVLIGMDEYLQDERTMIPYDDPLSFRRHLDERFYERLDPDLAPPPENRVVPDPARPDAVAAAIERAGGVDMCVGGIGITGHVAFNDPPGPDVPLETFRNLGTRVVELALETRVINSVTAANGNIDAIPRWAVTVGMKEILSARSVRIYMNRSWQPAIARRWVHGPVTTRVPASLLQEHPDVHLTLTEEAARRPAGRLR